MLHKKGMVLGVSCGLIALSGLLWLRHSANEQQAEYQRRYQQREAEFDQLCRTRAGYKINRVVTEVEGIRLLKVRHRIQDGNMFAPGAAFGLESEDDGYINNFLAYRYPISLADNSYGVSVSVNPGVQPGFRYVDVLDDKDGKYYRYTMSQKVVGQADVNAPMVKKALAENPSTDLNIYRWGLDRVPSPQPLARYAVTFEDSVIPEERAKGFASSKVLVLDMQTHEVLAEMVRYVWGPSQPTSYTPNPWLTTDKCPMVSEGANAATRQFVDRVLVAKGATLPPMPICKSCGQLP
jgi:hypothetical protein